ncbi:MAG: hypothetical protein ACKVYV_15595 [Limisphaerales bacterium]
MLLLGTIILWLGLIVMFVGSLWLLIVAFKESRLWGILLLLPFIKGIADIIFVILHWSVAKRPFFTQLAGVAVAIVGAVVGAVGATDEADFSPEELTAVEMTIQEEAAASGDGGAALPAAEPAAEPAVPIVPPPPKQAAFRPVPPPVEAGQSATPPRTAAVPEHQPPVKVEFVSLAHADSGTLGGLRLRAQNRASWPVRELKLDLFYLGEDGRPLKHYETVHSGDPVIVGPEATVEFDMPAFEMPRFTRKVRARVEAVEFQDGSRWPAEP